VAGMELRTRGLLTIGEFSRVSGLTIKALRHYDEIGLLQPWQVDPDTGYRHYALGQARDAEAIRRLRSLHLSLDEVRALLAADPELVRERLAAHRARIEGRAVETRRILAELSRLIEGKEPLVPQGEKFRTEFELDVKQVPERRVALVRERVHQDDMPSVVPRNIELVGGQLRAAGTRSAGPPFCRCPFADADGMLTTEIGWPVGHDVVVETPVELTTYIGGRALVCKHIGPYDELGRSYRLLSEVIESNDLVPVGDPVEWYLTDPKEVSDPNDYVTVIEWPIGPEGDLDDSRDIFSKRAGLGQQLPRRSDCSGAAGTSPSSS